jgi:hypothetical protein
LEASHILAFGNPQHINLAAVVDGTDELDAQGFESLNLLRDTNDRFEQFRFGQTPRITDRGRQNLFRQRPLDISPEPHP